MLQRFRCLGSLNITALRKRFHGACANPCHTLEYDLHVTATQWTPTDAQIHWLLALSDLFRQTSENRSTDRVMHYLHGPNRSAPADSSEEERATEFAFVVLSRDNYNTVERREMLIVSFNGLLSRLGGICSLSLGLSFAFVVELFEFLLRLARGDADERGCACGGARERRQAAASGGSGQVTLVRRAAANHAEPTNGHEAAES